MQAIILAAGKGSRLKSKTKNIAKCMVEIDGESMISRVLHQLDTFSLNRIIIVDGYLSDVLEEYILKLKVNTPIQFVRNDQYDTTNNIYSLYTAKQLFSEDDTILIESDLIFDTELLVKTVESQLENLAVVSRFKSWMDGTVVEMDANNHITSFIGKDDFDFSNISNYFKTVNVYKFSKKFINSFYVPYLEAQVKALGGNEYYETVIKTIINIDSTLIHCLDIEDTQWYEIDNSQDLDIAETLFTKDKFQKLKLFESRFGGYWRYPNLIDFCYLVNPFYPPQEMYDEFNSQSKRLIMDYPSGLRVNSNLVGKYYDIPENQIIVGNGAAELIKALSEELDGKMGIIAPTFEEYPNRMDENNVVKMYTKSPDFSYSSEDIIGFFGDKDVKSIVLINPDNPSGKYLNRESVLQLANWSKKMNIKLILDESFNDFVSSEKVSSFISKDILKEFPNLIIIKSISKSFGVPGVRLGFLCSSNEKLVAKLMRKVSIWNINSFGEFFLQIFEKYKGDYVNGLSRFYAVRDDYYQRLKEISEIRVIPSQSNYFMIELLKGNARELTADLLQENIFVKDLTEKDGIKGQGQYLRVAVKRKDENNLLVQAIKKYYR